MSRSRGPRGHRRLLVLIRDQQRCRYCGRELDPHAPPGHPDHLTLDHVIPFIWGGTNTLDNVVVACMPCNSRKADHMLQDTDLKLLPVPGGGHPLIPDVSTITTTWRTSGGWTLADLAHWRENGVPP